MVLVEERDKKRGRILERFHFVLHGRQHVLPFTSSEGSPLCSQPLEARPPECPSLTPACAQLSLGRILVDDTDVPGSIRRAEKSLLNIST